MSLFQEVSFRILKLTGWLLVANISVIVMCTAMDLYSTLSYLFMTG